LLVLLFSKTYFFGILTPSIMFQHDLFVRDLYFRILCVCNKKTFMNVIIMFFYCVYQGLWPSGCEEPVPANTNAHPLMHARAVILCWCLYFFELSNIHLKPKPKKLYRFDILHMRVTMSGTYSIHSDSWLSLFLT
jgi:hypothetical protein